MSLLDGLLQVHLELKGWLGYGVGQVVRHIDLQTHGEQHHLLIRLSVVLMTHKYGRIKHLKVKLERFRVDPKASGGAQIQLSSGVD